jgi:hypothetical protein
MLSDHSIKRLFNVDTTRSFLVRCFTLYQIKHTETNPPSNANMERKGGNRTEIHRIDGSLTMISSGEDGSGTKNWIYLLNVAVVNNDRVGNVGCHPRDRYIYTKSPIIMADAS